MSALTGRPPSQSHRSPAGRPAWRDSLAASLYPGGGRSTGAVEAGALLILAAIAAFYRLGPSAGRGAPWAEDGAVFLQQPYHGSWLHSFTVEYAGYLHFGPRLIAAVIVQLPLTWQGAGMQVAAALVQGLVAVLGYAAISDHVRQRWARLLVAACVVAVPVGPEVSDNVANLQWFLVFGAGIALFWTPRGRTGWTAIGVAVLVATMSSPFGFVVLLGALVRYLLQRGRPALVLLVLAAAGFVVQTLAMLLAPPRQQSLHHQYDSVLLARGYLARVLGDSVFGATDGSTRHEARDLVTGLVVLLVTTGLLGVLARRGERSLGTVAGAALALGLLTYLLPVAIAGPPVDLAWVGGRYYVTPVLFTETALIVVLAKVLDRRTDGVRAALRIGRLVSICLALGLLITLTRAYPTGSFLGRDTGTTWVTSVRTARMQCLHRADTAPVRIPVLPAHWGYLRLSCRDVR